MRGLFWMRVVLLACWIVAGTGHATEKPELVVQTGHGAPTFWLEYLNNPNFIISSDLFCTKIWNINDGHCIKTFKGAHRCLSRDKKLLLVQSNSSTLQVWSLDTLTLMREFKNIHGECVGDFVPSFSISPDGHYIAAAMSRNSMMWSLLDGSLQKTLTENVGRVEFSPDGKLMAIGGKTQQTMRKSHRPEKNLSQQDFCEPPII